MNIKIDKNDKLFSEMIRERDNWKCVFCGRSREQGYTLQNSHYWGRGNKTTRFDPLNCDTLCFTCHSTHEGSKQGFYREWKLKQLGEKVYKDLEKRARATGHYGVYEKKLVWEALKQQEEFGILKGVLL